MTLVVTGSAGRVGRALRLAWHSTGGPRSDVVWIGRNTGQGIDAEWDIGRSTPPPLPKDGVLLHLAGQTRGSAAELAENRRSAQVVCTSARQAGMRHVILMSSVAVYHPGSAQLTEASLPNPPSPYGQAKLDAEAAATQVLSGSDTGLILLRLGNLAGADALLRPRPAIEIITLDPVPDQPRGPERAYIGPMALAEVLRHRVDLIAAAPLPPVLNLAQPPALAMADLLDAAGRTWRFGPLRHGTLPRVAVATTLLASLVPLPPVTPASLIADLNQLRGLWP